MHTRSRRSLLASTSRLSLAAAFIGFAAGLAAPAAAQTTCPSPAVTVNAACEVPPGTTIIVAPANAIGLNASGAAGAITGNGVTVNLNAAGTTGALAQSGADITFDASTLRSTVTTAANASNQTGVRATGAGSTVSASGATINLAPKNAAGTAFLAGANMVGAVAESGGVLSFTNTSVSTEATAGAAAGGNHAIVSTGAGSTISFTGGAISALGARGSFGALAQAGGAITLGGGVQVTTTGPQIAATSTGSHGLLATGAGSRITGDGLTITNSGALASSARAEQGGAITLDHATINSSSTGSVDTDPSSAARALSGGTISIANSTINATGGRAHGLSVQDIGSSAQVSRTTISATGARSNGAFIFNGGHATISASSISAANVHAFVVDGAGSSITLTDTTLLSTAAVGYGLRVVNGGAATMTRGFSSTTGRDAPGLFAANGTISATGVTVTTSGQDNAMGVLADLGGQITLTGGAVTTSGDSVRAGARAHGLAARNAGGVLTATDTVVNTFGAEAMGAVADDGGVMTLHGVSITTQNRLGIGLFSVSEQVGAQFPASITGDGLTIETFGETAHGADAQARNDADVETATITLTDSKVTTHGAGAQGLRAVLGDYGNGPGPDRGEAIIIANGSTIATEGANAHGAYSRDNPTSITLNDTSVSTSGATAHGAVALSGGRIIGDGATIEAAGENASALFVASDAEPISTADFTDSDLHNATSPTIAIAGLGNVTLTGSAVGGSGEWLRVGTLDDFAPLGADAPPVGGVQEPLEDADAPVPPPLLLTTPPPTLAAVSGLANVDLTNSEVTGSAFTAPGSVSNLRLLADSLWTMTGNSNITNLTNDPSLIQFTPPIADPTLLSSYKTLTVVNYIGEGGAIGLNTFLGADDSPSDQLVIDGGAATGTSLLNVANTTGAGALTTGNGIPVVVAVNGGVTDSDVFSLGNAVVAGPYEYALFRGGPIAGAENNWFLRSTVDCTAADAPIPPCPAPPSPPVPPPPNYRPEVSLYTALPALAQLYGRALIGTLHDRVGEEEQLRHYSSLDDGEHVDGVWSRAIGLGGARKGEGGIYGPEGPEFDYNLFALQIGMDLHRERDDGVRDHAGIMGSIGRAEAEAKHFDGAEVGKDTIDIYSLGGYWTRFGEKGGYIDAVGQLSYFDARAASVRLPELSGSRWGGTLSVEIGKPLDLKKDQTVEQRGWVLEPQAQLIYQYFNEKDAEDAGGRLTFDNTDSLTGRIGARLANSWERSTADGPREGTVWGRFNVWHEFLDSPRTTFAAEDEPVTFQSNIGGTWLEANAGATAQISNSAALYMTASYYWDTEGKGDALGARLGARWNW